MGNELAVFLRIMLLFVIAAQQLHADPSVDPVSGTHPTHTFHRLDQKPAGTAVGSAAAAQEVPSTALTDVLNDDANHLYITDQGALVTHTTLDREDQNLYHMMVEAVDSQTPPSTAQNLKYPSVTENLNKPELQKEIYVTGSKKLNPESKPTEPLTPTVTEQKYFSVTENLNKPELQKEIDVTGSKELNPESKPTEPLTPTVTEQKYSSVTENLKKPELQKEIDVTGSKELKPESKPTESLTHTVIEQKYPSVTENLNKSELQKEIYVIGSKMLKPESKPTELLTPTVKEQKYSSVTENLNKPEWQKGIYVIGYKMLKPESKHTEPLTPTVTEQEYPSVTENLKKMELQKEMYVSGAKELNPASKPPKPLTPTVIEQENEALVGYIVLPSWFKRQFSHNKEDQVEEQSTAKEQEHNLFNNKKNQLENKQHLPPEFNQTDVSTAVTEYTGVNYPVYDFSVITPCCVDVRYRIIDGNELGNFKLNEKTGELTTATNLIYKEKNCYRLIVQLSPQHCSAFSAPPSRDIAKLTIYVKRVNETPEFLQQTYYATILNSAPYRFPVLKVEAKYADLGKHGIFRYCLVDQPGNEFAIDEITGQVYVVSVAGKTGTLSFKAQAVDRARNGLQAQTNIDVTVIPSSSNSIADLAVNQTINEVEKKLSEIERVLNDELQLDVHVVDMVSKTIGSEANEITGGTILRILGIGLNNQTLSEEELKRKFKEMSKDVEKELSKVFGNKVNAGVEEGPNVSMSPETIVNIVLGIVLTCVSSLFIAFAAVTAHRKRVMKLMPKMSAKSGSHEDGDSTTGGSGGPKDGGGKGSTIVDIGKNLIGGGGDVISALKDKIDPKSVFTDVENLIGGAVGQSELKEKTDPKSMFTDVENLIGGAVGQSVSKEITDPKTMFTNVGNLIGGAIGQSALKEKIDPKTMFTDVGNLIGGAVGQSALKEQDIEKAESVDVASTMDDKRRQENAVERTIAPVEETDVVVVIKDESGKEVSLERDILMCTALDKEKPIEEKNGQEVSVEKGNETVQTTDAKITEEANGDKKISEKKEIKTTQMEH